MPRSMPVTACINVAPINPTASSGVSASSWRVRGPSATPTRPSATAMPSTLSAVLAFIVGSSTTQRASSTRSKAQPVSAVAARTPDSEHIASTKPRRAREAGAITTATGSIASVTQNRPIVSLCTAVRLMGRPIVRASRARLSSAPRRRWFSFDAKRAPRGLDFRQSPHDDQGHCARCPVRHDGAAQRRRGPTVAPWIA